MYDGAPSIRLEGDRERALALIPNAKALLQRAQAFVQTAKVPTFSMSETLGPGEYIFVLVSNGQNLITISAEPQVVDKVTTEVPLILGEATPRYYSGCTSDDARLLTVMTDGKTSTTLHSFIPTSDTRQADPQLFRGKQNVPHLAVKPWAAYGELESPFPAATYSQYTLLRPTMYSGTMKKVVQAVMGLGRQRREAFVDDDIPGDTPSAYAISVEATGVQVRFDYKFHRTHGIYKGEDDTLWLVEISMTQGVLARPLPMFPASAVAKFRRFSDTAIAVILEELGGLPTGEAFPTGSALSAAIANGTVLRLAAPSILQPFYQSSPYATSMGWAFNDNGTEAHNTAWYFGDDGFIRSVWWAVHITIGPLRTRREPGEPIAEGSAVARLQREGFLYNYPSPVPTSPSRYLPIKFYEPGISGLYSFSAVPTEEAALRPQPKCDTVMFVCFVDNRIHTVSYYNDPRAGAYSNTTGEAPACPYGDSWDIYSVSGSRALTAVPYSNELDERTLLQEHTSATTYVSQYVGHDPPSYGDIILHPNYCFMTRNAVFKNTVTRVTTGGESLTVVIAIPAFSREAFYYASAHWYATGHSRSKTVSFSLLRDPHGYWGYRKFPGNFLNPSNCNPQVCNGQHTIRKVICESFQPSGCNEYADAGGWASQCDDIEALCRTPPHARRGSVESEDMGSDVTTKLILVTSGAGGQIEMPVTFSEVSNQWTAITPDPITGVAQILSATHSTLGSEAVVYDGGLYAGSRVRGTLPDGATASTAHCFVGVNNI